MTAIYVFLNLCEAIYVKWSCSAVSCPTLCEPRDCSLPGSSIHGIFQARVLEWVAISFSRGFSQLRYRTQVSHIAGKTLYCLSHQGSPMCFYVLFNFEKGILISWKNMAKKVPLNSIQTTVLQSLLHCLCSANMQCC